jgi:hypothetical protein
MAPPHIVGQRVEVGGAGAQGSTFGYTVTVDTSFAGFEFSPFVLVYPSFASAGPMPAAVLGPMLDIDHVAPTHFSLTVRYLAPNAAVAAATNQMSRPVATNPFAFGWIGIEPQRTFGVPSTPPPPLLF